MAERGLVQHLDPEDLPNNPAFTNVVVVSGPARTIYVGGQDAVTGDGEIVGKGDLAIQTEQVFRNLQACLASAGAGLEHVIKMNINLVDGQDLLPGFGVFQKEWPKGTPPPVVSVAMVAGLAHPDFLVEVEAVAVLPVDVQTG